jgi:hypothetical protein
MYASRLHHAIVLSLSVGLATADIMAGSGIPSPVAAGRPLHVVAEQTGTLARGATGVHAMRFENGREYRIVAACRGTCGGLTVQLFSPGGRELDRHQRASQRADVATIPSGSGTYEVEVTMARCESRSCDYSLTVRNR